MFSPAQISDIREFSQQGRRPYMHRKRGLRQFLLRGLEKVAPHTGS